MRFRASRRRIPQGASAAPLLALLPRAASSELPRALRLESVAQPLVGMDHPRTAVWSYNGGVPGPELRVRQGERHG